MPCPALQVMRNQVCLQGRPVSGRKMWAAEASMRVSHRAKQLLHTKACCSCSDDLLGAASHARLLITGRAQGHAGEGKAELATAKARHIACACLLQAI